MNRYGKSSRSKERRRWQRSLSLYWKEHPITTCEVRLPGCLGSFGLSPAHSKKRRFINSKADYFEIACACANCARKLDEEMTHEQMEQAVKAAIGRRDLCG